MNSSIFLKNLFLIFVIQFISNENFIPIFAFLSICASWLGINFNLLCLLEGKKEIILINPIYRKYLYEIDFFNKGSSWSYVDIWNIDYNKYPLFKNVKFYKFILNPGDILYIPPYWWHAVKNIDNSIAFTFHYYTIYSILTTDIPEIIIQSFSNLINLNK